MSNVIHLNLPQPHFPPGQWAVITTHPSAFTWHVVYPANVANAWASSLDPSGNHLLLQNTISKQAWVYKKIVPVLKGETKMAGLGAVADDTPTGTGFNSDDQTQVEANPTPDNPSAPSSPSNTLPTIIVPGSASGSSGSALPWILGGLVLTAGAFAAYTYSKKNRTGRRRKMTSRRH